MVEDKLDSLRLELEEFILQKMHHALKQFSKECKKTFFFFFKTLDGAHVESISVCITIQYIIYQGKIF